MKTWHVVALLAVVAAIAYYWFFMRGTSSRYGAAAPLVDSSGQTTGSPVPQMIRRPLFAIPKTM